MANALEIARILSPLVEQLDELMSGRDPHDSVALVRERLNRLVHALEETPPLVDRMKTLQELGFLREHSVADDLRSFNETVGEAIEAVLTAGWE